jgi:hypothetical protein
MLVLALSSVSLNAQVKGRRTTPPAPTKRTTPRRTTATATPRRASTPTATMPVNSRLTGLYHLNAASSDDPRAAAERATVNQSFALEQEAVDDLTARLTSPDQLSIERRGNTISIASTRAPRITFDADGRERVERAADGHTVRTRATLIADQLSVSSAGSPDDQFTVTFVSMDEGRRLRVIRSITTRQTDRPVVVQSVYDRVSSTARWNIYGEPETTRASSRTTARNTVRTPPPTVNNRNNRQQETPPVLGQRPPAPVETERNERDVYALVIPAGTQFVATLDYDLTTANTREGDPFRMTVRAPAQYEGATIEGTVARIEKSGRLSGRSQMTLDFNQIRLRDGRTAGFSGTIESVRTVGGEQVRVDQEGGGSIRENDSQTERTAQRAAIGAAVGAIIGAISGGGKGAAIGAAIGAGAGAGSVYVQGRDDLELRSGTELVVRSGAAQSRR